MVPNTYSDLSYMKAQKLRKDKTGKKLSFHFDSFVYFMIYWRIASSMVGAMALVSSNIAKDQEYFLENHEFTSKIQRSNENLES